MNQIKLFEVLGEEDKYAPTGRVIYLDEDCPLFQSDPWASGVEHGQLAISSLLFDALAKVVKETT